MFFGNSPSDFGFLPPGFKGDVQVFVPNGVIVSATQNWQNWTKPKGASMVYMLCIGGGGGGGAGHSAASGTARGGGGGGSSGALTSLMLPATLIPDSLKISPGAGGRGGIAAAGVTAEPSYIALGSAITPGTSIPNLILRANGGGGGGLGTVGAAGAAGGAAAVTAITALGPIGKLGFFTNNGTAANAGYAGIAGTAGGAQTGAVGVTLTAVFNTFMLSGGAGGAGVGTTANTGFAGGAITLQAAVDFADGTLTPASNYIPGGTAGSGTVVGGNGSAGVNLFKPFLQTGGSGGGSASAQTYDPTLLPPQINGAPTTMTPLNLGDDATRRVSLGFEFFLCLSL